MMKRIVISCMLCLCGAVSVVAQDVDALVNESMGHFKQSDFERFEEIFRQIYVAYLKENLPSYEKAVAAIGEGDEASAFTCLNELIDDGYFLDEIATDTNFKALHGKADWELLLQQIRTLTNGYNNELRRELREIQDRDQSIRILYLQVKNDPSGEAVHEYMRTVVDPACVERIYYILDNYGWLGEEAVGSEANETLFLGIQHVDDVKVQATYMPMLRQAVQEGKADGWHLAFLTDRILMNQGRKQIYGTQKVLSSVPGRSYIIPLEYPEKVDELRHEVGLQSLGEDLEKEGMHWDLNEYLQRLPEIEKMYRERYESSK